MLNPINEETSKALHSVMRPSSTVFVTIPNTGRPLFLYTGIVAFNGHEYYPRDVTGSQFFPASPTDCLLPNDILIFEYDGIVYINKVDSVRDNQYTFIMDSLGMRITGPEPDTTHFMTRDTEQTVTAKKVFENFTQLVFHGQQEMEPDKNIDFNVILDALGITFTYAQDSKEDYLNINIDGISRNRTSGDGKQKQVNAEFPDKDGRLLVDADLPAGIFVFKESSVSSSFSGTTELYEEDMLSTGTPHVGDSVLFPDNKSNVLYIGVITQIAGDTYTINNIKYIEATWKPSGAWSMGVIANYPEVYTYDKATWLCLGRDVTTAPADEDAQWFCISPRFVDLPEPSTAGENQVLGVVDGKYAFVDKVVYIETENEAGGLTAEIKV